MMTLSQAANILGCEFVGHDVVFSAVSTDSRAINTGDLFIALQGKNFDGTTFVDTAVQKGAVAALISIASSLRCNPSPSCPLLLVNDTRLALGLLAAHWRAQFKIPLVAVTGSNGKTTVKEMLASILRVVTNEDNTVLATSGNLNNDIGVPLTLLKLRAEHRYAVIEMGMNHLGEIEYLSQMALPDVAIINNAGNAHLAGLGSINAVARAKGEIFTGLSLHGKAIINADDAHAPLWRELSGKRTIIEFGLEKKRTVHAQWQATNYGAYITISVPKNTFHAQLQVPGIHNVYNALAATSAALALDIPISAIVTGLENFPGVPGRLQRKTTPHGAMLIDDSYNANPASLRAALKVLAQCTGRKILVLGDMGELGKDAVRMHEEIGAEARHLGVNQLLALGKLSLHAVHGFGSNACHFENIEDLLDVLDKILDADSTLLVKGSRFMRMERVVQHCTWGNRGIDATNKKSSVQDIQHPALTICLEPTKRNNDVT